LLKGNRKRFFQAKEFPLNFGLLQLKINSLALTEDNSEEIFCSCADIFVTGNSIAVELK
jgi:hypothetical protein